MWVSSSCRSSHLKDCGNAHGEGLLGNMGLPEEVAGGVDAGHPVQVHPPRTRIPR